jgi:hypothetical protein
MKKFIYNLFRFSLPFIVFSFAIHMFIIWYPNSFNLKANFIKNNPNVEVLFLGSSHTQNGINPEYISKKTANLAYGGQDYAFDYKLFFKLAPKLEKLKYLFFEVDYQSLEFNQPSTYFRNSWYLYYYDISVFKVDFLEKVSIYFSSPSFFNDYILRELNPKEYKYNLNQHGFIVNDSPGIFKTKKYNVKLIDDEFRKSKVKFLIENSIEIFQLNKKRLLTVINYCKKKGINVILLSNPVYSTYTRKYITEINNRRLKLIDSLKLENISTLNYETDSIFTVYDYKDAHHLNSFGAKKLTKLINREIENLEINK